LYAGINKRMAKRGVFLVASAFSLHLLAVLIDMPVLVSMLVPIAYIVLYFGIKLFFSDAIIYRKNSFLKTFVLAVAVTAVFLVLTDFVIVKYLVHLVFPLH